MSSIIETLRREISNPGTRFVFPSEAAAGLWAQEVCVLGITRSAARNRFLAWDRFKEECFREDKGGRAPASSLIRRLFAETLAARNAAAGAGGGEGGSGSGLPFTVIIPREFMPEGSLYAASIAEMLPSLALWEALKNEPSYTPSAEDRGEDRDLEILKGEYASFLASHNLFEPSWERPRFEDSGGGYYIFFPEAMEDFGEYRKILEASPSIHLIHTDTSGPRAALQFGSVRGEVRSLLLELRRLHEEEGIGWEEMAVNVPELEELEPYLLRELSLYNIPFRRRSGRPLNRYGAGKLFSLIGECGGDNFSFSSLKTLLLDGQIPWRNPLANKSLILFGIRNNCVSSYTEGGRMIDIWEEAFEAAEESRSLAAYYRGLKKSAEVLSGAKSFADIRKHYFAFRGGWWEKTGSARGSSGGDSRSGFLDRDRCSNANNDILARCVEELNGLVKLEEEYPDLKPQNHFAFFLSLLKETQYVPQEAAPGVNIFPYRVAAAAPFRAHFIINASQSAAPVVYRPLKFLRQDKRGRLRVSDYDASGDFFSLYRSEVPASVLRISSSEDTVSGAAIPHSWFAGNIEKQEAGGNDPFPEEKAWWTGEGAFPAGIFPVQKEGFERWYSRILPWAAGDEETAAFDMLAAPFPPPLMSLVKERIRRVQREEGGLRISATDLTEFFRCPILWYYRKVFGLKPYSLEAELLDDKSLGNLYHEILKNLFGRIKKRDGDFKPENLDEYKGWALECTLEAARNYPAFEGPLASPLISAQAKAISKKLVRLLEMEKNYFPNYRVGDLEKEFAFPLEIQPAQPKQPVSVLVNGKIDRVSVSPEGEPIIVDYKTGRTPTKAQSAKSADRELEDFQIPLYVLLYEMTGRNIPVAGAFFASINKSDLTAIVGRPGSKKGYTREEFEETVASLEGYMEEFAGALDSPDFSRVEKLFKKCSECGCKKICRTTYSLNARASLMRDEDGDEDGGGDAE
jgi:RecB family exonuclease